jgi:hypothetical protein
MSGIAILKAHNLLNSRRVVIWGGGRGCYCGDDLASNFSIRMAEGLANFGQEIFKTNFVKNTIQYLSKPNIYERQPRLY